MNSCVRGPGIFFKSLAPAGLTATEQCLASNGYQAIAL